MSYDKKLIAGKLRRWEKYLNEYKLPSWDQIPDLGLYMEQVTLFLKEYLDYMPPELKEEQLITPAAINNYVRRKLMPMPVKKRYYRVHLAYLIMICSLKQSLSISTLHMMLPADKSEEEIKDIYDSYVQRHRISSAFFIEQIRILAAGILDRDIDREYSAGDTDELIISSAVISGFGRLLAEKLILLE